MPAAGSSTRTQRSPGAPRLLDDVGFLLSRSGGLAVRATNVALETHGLRVRQYSVLVAVAESTGVSQRDIAATLSLDPSQVVTLVDELETRGLVERTPDLADRRARLVKVTRPGRRVIGQAEVAVREAGEDYLGTLDQDERATLLALLRRLNGFD